MQVQVEQYIPDLRARMLKAGVTGQALAQQLGHKDASQVSRWLTENTERQVMPSFGSVTKIEHALKQLTRRRAK